MNLDELVQLETAGILLIGWIQFSTRHSAERLDYNTRANRMVDKFVAGIRKRWLGEPLATGTTSPQVFGSELDIKFGNLLHYVLEGNEVVLAQCFTPPIKYQKRFLGLRRIDWRPGHLVVLTSGNRLVWLKDEYRGRWERYAGITVSAPASLFRSCVLEDTPDHSQLIIDFLPGASWRVPVYDSRSGWAGFSQAVRQHLGRPEDRQTAPP